MLQIFSSSLLLVFGFFIYDIFFQKEIFIFLNLTKIFMASGIYDTLKKISLLQCYFLVLFFIIR